MIVGKGLKSGKEYTAVDKLNEFKKTYLAVVKEEKRVDQIKKDSKESVDATIDYWIDEYMDSSLKDPAEQKEYKKQMKELVKIKVKEIKKMDQTTRLALENEALMLEEAGDTQEIFPD